MSYVSFIITFGLCFALISFLGKGLEFNLFDYFKFNIPTFYGITIGLVLLAFGIFQLKKQKQKLDLSLPALALSLLVIFISDWINKPYNLIQGPIIRGEIILLSGLGYLAFKYLGRKLFYILALFVPLMLYYLFFEVSEGRILFVDDHAVFFYRLTLLKENFPNFPFYNPYWNAGYDARDFFATGVLNVFTFFWPIIYGFSLENSYNYIVATITFIIPALFSFIAARIYKLPNHIACIASVLTLTSSAFLYRWALQYGTMGFLTSLALIPVNFAFTAKILAQDGSFSKRDSFIFPITFTLMLFWTPAGLPFVPAGVWGLLKFRSLISNRNVLITSVLIILLNVPWLAAFWNVSQVGNFIAKQQTEGPLLNEAARIQNNEPPPESMSLPEMMRIKGTRILREYATSTSPLVFIFGLAGIFLLPKTKRKLFFITTLWLITIGAFIAPLKPRLEFERHILVMTMLLCIPAANVLALMLERLSFQSKKEILASALYCFCLGIFLVMPLSTGSIILNRTLIRYAFADQSVQDMAKIISETGAKHPNSRIAYSGFVLHELSQGHLAPLAYHTNIPLVACSPVHNQWRYKQLVPASYFDRGKDGIEEYFNIINASAVFAHEEFWKNYFTSHPEIYSLVWKGGKFSLFERKNDNNYFYEGSGEVVKQSTNSVVLKLTSPSAVIKFNYFPFLTSSACDLSLRRLSEEIGLVALDNCPLNTEITIRSIPLWKRMVGMKK